MVAQGQGQAQQPAACACAWVRSQQLRVSAHTTPCDPMGPSRSCGGLDALPEANWMSPPMPPLACRLQTFVETLAALRGGGPAGARVSARQGHAFGAAVAALGLSNKAVFNEDGAAAAAPNAGELGKVADGPSSAARLKSNAMAFFCCVMLF